jgi:hypothetical protein
MKFTPCLLRIRENPSGIFELHPTFGSYRSAALWEQAGAQFNHWAAFVAGYRAIGYDYDQAGFELIF